MPEPNLDFARFSGALLNELRRRRKLTTGQLARLSGRTAATISRYEANKILPPPEAIHALATVLGYQPWDLIRDRRPLQKLPDEDIHDYINRVVDDAPPLPPAAQIEIREAADEYWRARDAAVTRKRRAERRIKDRRVRQIRYRGPDRRSGEDRRNAALMPLPGKLPVIAIRAGYLSTRPVERTRGDQTHDR